MKRVICLMISVLLLCNISVKAEEPHHTRWWEVQDWDSEEQIEDEIKEGEMEMLAQLIEAEAGNQDFIGKCLVADVVLNRRDSEKYPNTIEEVIQDRQPCVQFATVSVYDGGFERAGWNISDDSFKAAQQEYEAKQRIDNKILYFTAGGYNPYCTPAYKYGDHYFGY